MTLISLGKFTINRYINAYLFKLRKCLQYDLRLGCVCARRPGDGAALTRLGDIRIIIHLRQSS